MDEEKPDYKLRLSDLKPWVGLYDYVMRNNDNDLRVMGRKCLLSVYNVAVLGALIGTAVVAEQGLEALFNLE